jgi:benzoate-CoA ligase
MQVTGQPIKDGIGATETCFLFMANRGGEYRPGSCGHPLPGAEVKLVGDGGEEITEANKPGILWVRTLSVAAGYWNMSDRTRAAFKNGWYRTGDMFERDADGWYWHSGRGDDMLKVSGQWVSPGEIEDFVLKIPVVQDAAVVGVPNEDGLTRLALFLVAPEAKGRTEDLKIEIENTLTSNLSIYKCPRRMFFMDGLPMTATGKVQRYALRQMVVDGSVSAD